MTTGLDILVDSVGTCLQVPLEAIQSDSVTFVYKKDKSGFIKQEVVTGPSNDVNVSIAAGLAAGDEVSLNAPPNSDELAVVYLEDAVRTEAKAALEKAMAERLKIQQEIARTIKAEQLSGEESEGGFFIMF